MPFHRNVAAAVRAAKNGHPELFCRAAGCLYRTVNSRTGASTPCPKHPAPAAPDTRFLIDNDGKQIDRRTLYGDPDR